MLSRFPAPIHPSPCPTIHGVHIAYESVLFDARVVVEGQLLSLLDVAGGEQSQPGQVSVQAVHPHVEHHQVRVALGGEERMLTQRSPTELR